MLFTIVPWTKVARDPLSLSGIGLGAALKILAILPEKNTKLKRRLTWVVTTLAAVCVVGGLGLAYRHESAREKAAPTVVLAPTPVNSPGAPSMHIDKLEQKVRNGNAVAGVNGNVTIQSPPSIQNSHPPK